MTSVFAFLHLESKSTKILKTPPEKLNYPSRNQNNPPSTLLLNLKDTYLTTYKKRSICSTPDKEKNT